MRPASIPIRPLAEDFETPSLETWRALARKALKGAEPESLTARTYDGIEVPALCTAADAGPAPVRPARPASGDPERPWDLRSVVDHPSPARAGEIARKELSGGAASLLVRIDPTAADGVAVADQDGLGQALGGVLLDIAPVALDAGLLGPRAADWLAVLAKGAPTAPLAFHMDPLSAFAETGAASGRIEDHLTAAANAAARHAPAYPRATAFLASGRVVHEALGSDAQELGFMTAAALAYAKAQVDAGLTLEQAFARVVLGLSADAAFPEQIAKLRAARTIWRRLTQACGAERPAVIEARASRRMLAARDPWTNLLRLTAAGFAAGTGGADAVVLEPFTRPLGAASDLARRQARNTQLVLMEEAALGRVADPAAGAFLIERLTDGLARAGWAFFQGIEREGGLAAALRSGFVADTVAATAERRRADLAERRPPLVGVTTFPNPDEAAVAVEAVDRAAFALADPMPGQAPQDRCPPLRPGRLSAPFEAADPASSNVLG